MRGVFVSSTSKGMDAVRQPVIRAVNHMDGFAPIAMENFGLRADTPLSVCMAKVAEAEVFLGIIGHEYGSCPHGLDVSYTRAEYNEAVERGLPRLMFVLPVPDGVAVDPRQDALRRAVLADGLAVVREVDPADCAMLTAAGLGNLPAKLPQPRSSNLPSVPKIFGREADIGLIVSALTRPGPNPPPIAVLGHAGIGKTTVTLGVLHDPLIRARHGVHRFFAALETVRDADAMRTAIVVACGLDPRSARFEHALAHLAEARPSLLVLDNLETPLAADPTQVEDDLLLLSQVEGLALVVSRRGTERPGGPDWMVMDPLAPLSAEASRALFLRWAARIRPDDPDLAPLLADLGGLALALMLVARRAAPDSTLAGTMRDWRRKGTEQVARRDIGRDAQGRLDALAVSLALSTDRLGAEGKRLFALLARTPAGMAETDIATLLGDDATEAMARLRISGLAAEAPGRLDLLSPVRDHALRTTALAAEDTAWFQHYLKATERFGSLCRSGNGGEALAALVPDLPNVEAAIDAAVASGNLQQGLASEDGLSLAIRFSGFGSPRPLEALASACAAAAKVLGEANCIKRLGDIALARSDHDAARARYAEALALYQRVGDVLGEANCIQSLGDIALRRSDHDAARARYVAALPLYQRVGDVLGEANCIQGLGDIALARSDHDAARARYEAALPLYQRVGDVLGEANCIKSLGDIALDRSDHDAARARYAEALPLYKRVGAVLGEANCIRSLGDIALRRSDHDAARARYAEALLLHQRVGDLLGEANCIKRLGDIALARSDHDAARARYAEALPLYRRVGAVLGEANGIQGFGRIAEALGDRATACARYHEALALFTRIHRLDAVAVAHEDLAVVTSDAARESHVQAARETWLAIGLPDQAARVERRFR